MSQTDKMVPFDTELLNVYISRIIQRLLARLNYHQRPTASAHMPHGF